MTMKVMSQVKAQEDWPPTTTRRSDEREVVMKVKTQVKAGKLAANHNTTVR
jgi:hypothetical protein